MMNADAFRKFYDYHFAENRKIWDAHVVSLTQEQFTQHVDYSMGSVRNQTVHMMDADDYWFYLLRGLEPPPTLKPEDFEDRATIRQYWDAVEQRMHAYMAELRDEMLFTKPFTEGDDKEIVLWEVLLHVGNHGTDHRAQLLRMLHDMGCETGAQDYIFYAFDRLQGISRA
jgi:uncharacterized damage-inducible protein DinB